jgi:HEAT repeat protein
LTLVCAIICAVLGTNVRISPAQDAQSAAADLAHAGDFRVRVSAALLLGKSRPEGARLMLEHALDDTHPAVRTAAAAALGVVGDPQAAASLERHLQSEPSGSVRAQIKTTLDGLRQSGIKATAAAASKARYFVQLGAMKNLTGIRGGELSQVMRAAARAQAASLPGALVVEGDTPSSGTMPVLLLDGQLTRLAQASAGGTLRVEAQVEFSVRRIPQQTLKGTLSGTATSMESARTITTGRVLELQNAAVGGAVESAMRGADHGLTLAAK